MRNARLTAITPSSALPISFSADFSRSSPRYRYSPDGFRRRLHRQPRRNIPCRDTPAWFPRCRSPVASPPRAPGRGHRRDGRSDRSPALVDDVKVKAPHRFPSFPGPSFNGCRSMGVALLPFLQIVLRTAGLLLFLRIAFPGFPGLAMRTAVGSLAGIVLWRLLAHRAPPRAQALTCGIVPGLIGSTPANGNSGATGNRARDHHHQIVDIDLA